MLINYLQSLNTLGTTFLNMFYKSTLYPHPISNKYHTFRRTAIYKALQDVSMASRHNRTSCHKDNICTPCSTKTSSHQKRNRTMDRNSESPRGRTWKIGYWLFQQIGNFKDILVAPFHNNIVRQSKDKDQCGTTYTWAIIVIKTIFITREITIIMDRLNPLLT